MEIWSDFWTPQNILKYKEEYDSGTSSKIMWALHLMYHPESDYYELPLKVKQELISTDYLDGEPFDPSAFKNVLDKIIKYNFTKSQASMLAWETKLEERDAFMATQPYDFNTYDALDKMLGQTYKLWGQYFSIKKQLENDEGRTSGDIEESLADKGLLL